jgi:hypothetical protein
VDFIKFCAMIIIASLIFNPIDKKYKLRLKYHNHLNKRFRFYIMITMLLSCAIELLIAFLPVYIFRELVSFIFIIPILFGILVDRLPL